MRPSKRWLTFNAVGVIGFAVQMGTLALLLRAGFPYLAATALSVEAAILHNFVWHERWTWRDRPASGAERLGRLRRFHVMNGVISMAGNLAIMTLLYGLCGVPAMLASIVAIGVCSLANYFASELAVFTAASCRTISSTKAAPSCSAFRAPMP